LAAGGVLAARGALGSVRAMLGLLGLDPFDPAYAAGGDSDLREQGQHLRKIADAVAEEIKAVHKLQQDLQAGQTQHKLLSDRLDRVIEQKMEAAGIARCGLHLVNGETMVRTMPFAGDTTAIRALPAKDLKARLRGTPSGGEVLFADSAGTLDWHLNPRQRFARP